MNYPFTAAWLRDTDRSSPPFRDYCELRAIARMSLERGPRCAKSYLSLVEETRGHNAAERLRTLSKQVLEHEGKNVLIPQQFGPAEKLYAATA